MTAGPIATVGPLLPHDLLRADGREVHVVSVDVDRPISRAANIFENRFAPWCAALVEDWMCGAFDQFDSVVFSRGDDTVQRLYYYVCELQRRGLMAGPEPLLFDVCLIDRPSSEARQAREVRELARLLGVDEAALEASIVATNRVRKDEAVELDGNTCLIAGTPPPDDRLHRAIASGGCTPLGDTLYTQWADLGPPVAEGSGEPALALARQIRARPSVRSFGDPATAIAERIAPARPSCGIFWLSEDDETTGWHLLAMRRPFDEAGIPLLVLTRRDPALKDGVEEEIAAFVQEHSR